MDELLNETLKKYETLSFADKLEKEAENSFLNMKRTDEEKSRSEEREALRKELRECRKKLLQLRNVKSIARAKYNNHVAAKRKVINTRIDEIKNTLGILEDEEDGSKIDAGVLTNQEAFANATASISDWKGVY
jgi:hypothetical protein